MIREYIRQVLRESPEGGMGGDFYGPGGGFTTPKGLWDTFIQPALDVAQMAKGKTKELANEVWTIARVALETVKVMIPMMEADYEKIYKKRDERLAKIQNEYKKHYDAVENSLGGDDARTILALADPTSLIATWIGVKGTYAAGKDALSVVTGGRIGGFGEEKEDGGEKDKKREERDKKDREERAKQQAREKEEKEAREKKEKEKKEKEKKKTSGPTEALYVRRNFLFEEKVKLSELSPEQMQEFLTPETRRLIAHVRSIIDETLEETLEKAETLAGAKTFDDIKGLVDKPIKDMDKIKKMSPEEQQQHLKILKASTIQFYIHQLKEELEANKLPEGHYMVRAYSDAIAKLKKMQK